MNRFVWAIAGVATAASAAAAPPREAPKPADVSVLGPRVLFSPETSARYRAVEKLDQFGTDDALPFLIVATADPDADVVAAAVQALGRRKQNAKLILPLLVKLLETEQVRNQPISNHFQVKRSVRYDAAEALRNLGREAELAAPPLARHAGIRTLPDGDDEPGDADYEVRIRAALAYARVTGRRDEALKTLLTLLESESFCIRDAAAWALGEMGHDAAPAAEALVKRLRTDDESGVRSSAAWALGEIGAGNDGVKRALYAALEDEEDFVVSHAAESLARLSESSPEFLRAVISVYEMRPYFIGSLVPALQAGMGETEALKLLREEFAASGANRRRIAIATLVGELGSRDSIRALDEFASQTSGELCEELRQIRERAE